MKTLLFIPDISGFTNFVNTTEVEHSQHVIAELLEILIDANSNDLQLAEVEGDALFFYQEGEIPSLENLLWKAENMFTAFYSHLKLMETNRICPCNACSSAPDLNLKIIAHSGEVQFISVQDSRKPFGSEVIEVHRLMKNSVEEENYMLISKELSKDIGLPENYRSKLFDFQPGQDEYDGKTVSYDYSKIAHHELKLKPFEQVKKVDFGNKKPLKMQHEFPVPALEMFEFITNYKYRYDWVKGVDQFKYNENEVTKLGTKHVCVINGKDLDFIAVTKEVKPGQLVYGELALNPPIVDKLYQFFIINPLTENSCSLELEVYAEANNMLKNGLIKLFAKGSFKKNMTRVMNNLHTLVVKESSNKS